MGFIDRLRKLNGTSTIFRANAVSQGSNRLNGSYDREKVAFDQGNGNKQNYNMEGATVKLEWDLDGATLTSLTSYDQAAGESNGDIDGGYGAIYLPEMGPGVIPFQSQTTEASDSDQIVQELILGYEIGNTSFITGASYFKSHLSGTFNPYFLPKASVHHENEAWSIFGSLENQVTNSFSIGMGFNYMHDDKSLKSESENVSVDDSQWSTNLHAQFHLNPDLTIWGKVATGFRGPSIQGRDIAFGGNASTADSETIKSFELGTNWIKGNVSLDATVFTYSIDDYQLTALGGSGNNVQLVNAESAHASGGEIELDWKITDSLSLSASAAYIDTEIDDPNLLVASCGSQMCTPKDPSVQLSGGTFLSIDGNDFPNAPKETYSLSLNYTKPVGDLILIGNVTTRIQGETQIFLYDSEEFTVDTQFEVDLMVGIKSPGEKYSINMFATNITDEENIEGAIDFNNLTVFTNEPRTFGVSAALNF